MPNISDMTHLALQTHIGTEVTGNRRFPRSVLEAKLDGPMLKSNGATLFGLRRIGKSSEAAAMCERLKALGNHVVKEDVQGKTSEGELVLAILKKLPEVGMKGRLTKVFMSDDSLTTVLRDTLSKFTGKVEDVQAYFVQISTLIEQSIDATENIILVIDEFPWLCRSILQSDPENGRQRVDLLLAALRKWRSKGMRMLLIGSIGMVALGRSYKLDLSHINDLQPLQIPPLNKIEAENMCAALARGEGINDWTFEHTQALIEETVALYPVMLQKGFQAMTTGGLANISELSEIFSESVRPDLDGSYYTQFDHRLKLYNDLPTPLPNLISNLLDCAFATPNQISRADLENSLNSVATNALDADISDALQILREDGFLSVRIEKDGSQMWRISSELVTAWRLQRRGSRR